ncbi:hydroxyacid dehydrogenase [Candidatus Woesearchaeota archaeon]|nr:hydroxyacid dehydrogenase [Candidatus Woesearchaeota archaeon]
MKIACFELEAWEEQFLRNRLPKAHFLVSRKRMMPKDHKALADTDVLTVFVYSPITESILNKMPKLKLICTMSTGYDHIDLEACRRRDVVVCNVPSYGENTVAEHAMALLLAISRKIVPSVERTRRGDFSLDGLRGFDLAGKTIGVVGVGRIGTHIIKMAKGFEMNVLGYSCHPDKKLARKLGFSYTPFDTLLQNSDIITFHVPATAETEHMLNEKNIRLLKKGCVIINTARGSIIETEALLHALDKGTVAYAGLDVLEGECFVREEKELISTHFGETCDLRTILGDHLLLKRDNVLITPHNAFNTTEALTRILEATASNIEAYRKKEPINTIKGGKPTL